MHISISIMHSTAVVHKRFSYLISNINYILVSTGPNPVSSEMKGKLSREGFFQSLTLLFHVQYKYLNHVIKLDYIVIVIVLYIVEMEKLKF